MITRHRFYLLGVEIVQVYWYEDRYRYIVNQLRSLEYRELVCEQQSSTRKLEELISKDICDHPYGEQQLKAKCIRCSKHHGAPRKEYNLASICDRCYRVMVSDTKANTASVFYMINEDGSKGSAMK